MQRPHQAASFPSSPALTSRSSLSRSRRFNFEDSAPARRTVILSFDNSAGTAGGTTKSASVTITGDDFYAKNLTIENSFSRNRPLTQEGSQAFALKLMSDRAVFRRVRFLGYQDTLYPNSKRCETDKGPCIPARQYFSECYIEGNVDFIFGDAIAYFDHCRLTAEKGAARVYLGRPWRAYSTVVWLNTEMGPEILPEGWHEWEHDGKTSLPTSFYAEYRSTGSGARPDTRKQLTEAETALFALKTFLAGDDQWDPTKVH